MKILLILLEINSDCQWHVGLAYISAILKKSGFEVKLFEMRNLKEDLAGLLEAVKNYQPGIISISANSHQFHYVKIISAELKKQTSAPIFVGGVHATLKPEVLVDERYIDGVCVGEGEVAFLELVQKIKAGQSFFQTNNFWFRDNNNIIKNNVSPLIENLDVLPMPDRTIFSYFVSLGKKVPRFIFSRGCPFECSYCCNHAFKKIYKGLGQYVRWRSVDAALREIEELRQKHEFDHFKLDDDTFSLNKVWLKEFCEKLAAKNWSLTFECNVRPGTLDEESAGLLKKAGCVMVKIGIESGSPDLRRRVLNRLFSNEDVIKTFNLARKFGLKSFSFNMIGVPEETSQTIQETIDLNRQIKPDFMQVTAFYPYPGTVLGDLCFAKGYATKDFEDSYMEKSVLNLPTISARQIEAAVKNFKFNAYWGYNKKMALREKVSQLKKSIKAHPRLHRLARAIYHLTKK